jgi:hypothetical protein
MMAMEEGEAKPAGQRVDVITVGLDGSGMQNAEYHLDLKLESCLPVLIRNWVGAQGIGEVLKLLHHVGLHLVTLIHAPFTCSSSWNAFTKGNMYEEKKICLLLKNGKCTARI